MKRVFLLLLLLIVLTSIASAQADSSSCNLGVTLVDQDPYPAVPGEYVDLVFQVTGVDNPNCGALKFALQEEYPIDFDPGFDGVATAESGVFARNFRSFWLIPMKVRLDSSALDGKNQIEAVLSNSQNSKVFQFDLNVEDTRTDFEVNIKDYDSTTQTLTFEILNTGDNDIKALTVEIPKQENIDVKGSKRTIVGDLDSNEDSSFSFEAKPSDGEITLTIIYSDAINERRTIEKTVTFDSSYFKDRVSDKSSKPLSFYLLILLTLGLGGYWFYRRWKKKKAHKKHLIHHSN